MGTSLKYLAANARSVTLFYIIYFKTLTHPFEDFYSYFGKKQTMFCVQAQHLVYTHTVFHLEFSFFSPHYLFSNY